MNTDRPYLAWCVKDYAGETMANFETRAKARRYRAVQGGTIHHNHLYVVTHKDTGEFLAVFRRRGDAEEYARDIIRAKGEVSRTRDE